MAQAANPPSVFQTPTQTRVSSLSEQRRQRGGGQAPLSLPCLPPPARGAGRSLPSVRLLVWSEGVGVRRLGERQTLKTAGFLLSGPEGLRLQGGGPGKGSGA